MCVYAQGLIHWEPFYASISWALNALGAYEHPK